MQHLDTMYRIVSTSLNDVDWDRVVGLMYMFEVISLWNFFLSGNYDYDNILTYLLDV